MLYEVITPTSLKKNLINNFITSVDKVIPINKPVLLFYGIEQLATLYSYMHFNFTQENSLIQGVITSYSIHYTKLYDVTEYPLLHQGLL